MEVTKISGRDELLAALIMAKPMDPIAIDYTLANLSAVHSARLKLIRDKRSDSKVMPLRYSTVGKYIMIWKEQLTSNNGS
jgi:hypothetical protein